MENVPQTVEIMRSQHNNIRGEKGPEGLGVSAPGAGEYLEGAPEEKYKEESLNLVCFSFMQICHTFTFILTIEHD